MKNDLRAETTMTLTLMLRNAVVRPFSLMPSRLSFINRCSCIRDLSNLSKIQVKIPIDRVRKCLPSISEYSNRDQSSTIIKVENSDSYWLKRDMKPVPFDWNFQFNNITIPGCKKLEIPNRTNFSLRNSIKRPTNQWKVRKSPKERRQTVSNVIKPSYPSTFPFNHSTRTTATRLAEKYRRKREKKQPLKGSLSRDESNINEKISLFHAVRCNERIAIRRIGELRSRCSRRVYTVKTTDDDDGQRKSCRRRRCFPCPVPGFFSPVQKALKNEREKRQKKRKQERRHSKSIKRRRKVTTPG